MAKKEKFTIVSVISPRKDSWLVEIDGGTSFLTARVYVNLNGEIYISL